MMLSLDTAYRSFGGEVEASNTPTICRLPDSRRHQLSAMAAIATPVLRCCRLAARLLFRQAQPIFRLGHPDGLVNRITLCELSAECSPQNKLQPSSHWRPLPESRFVANLRQIPFSALLPSGPLSQRAC